MNCSGHQGEAGLRGQGLKQHLIQQSPSLQAPPRVWAPATFGTCLSWPVLSRGGRRGLRDRHSWLCAPAGPGG